jgi:hypothetical protein
VLFKDVCIITTSNNELENEMSKVTIATVKSFIRKNANAMYISRRSQFDGMCDCVMPTGDSSFVKTIVDPTLYKATLGVNGAWFVGESRDYLTAFEKNGFKGFEVYNSCGSFAIATKI